MPSATELAANRFIFTCAGELKLSHADGSRKDFHRIACVVESERVNGIGAGDAKMNRDSSRNKNAVRNEQVLLCDHAHGDRAIAILFRPKIVLYKLA